MQSPETVLSILADKARNKDFKFSRLYRHLYNTGFYYQAYYEMSPKEGNMTAGADNKTLDGMKLKNLDKLISSLKDFSYQPNPARRTYIPKKNNPQKKRPLGIPSIEDKLIQYAIKYILEAIYEGSFSEHSHGFRPRRSCHTALREIKSTFRGFKWFIEGDIKGFFDNIDHHVLVDILRRRIADEHFLGLIWKFLKAGYLEDWEFHKTFSGTPQGGIISPILANIYLNELDTFMQELQKRYNKGKPTDRQFSRDYAEMDRQCRTVVRHNKAKWAQMTGAEKNLALNKARDLRHERAKHPVYDPLDTSYKKLVYVRYADDFLIGEQGSKEDAVSLKAQIKEFLQNELKLELSEEKTVLR